MYFGLPGSGKTTFAAYLTKRYSKHKIDVYSNYPIKGALRLDTNQIGRIDYSDCLMIIDEASIDYNNRNYKSMPKQAIAWFKMHRHYSTEIAILSQAWNDVDITLRRLCQRYYVIKKSAIPFFISLVRINRSFDINEQSKEPCDAYSFDSPIIRIFTTRRIFTPVLWKLFDSWDRPELPKISKESWYQVTP